MAIAIPGSRAVKPSVFRPSPLESVLESAQMEVERALLKYPISEQPTFHSSCDFGYENLANAVDEMEKHLGVCNLLEKKCASGPCSTTSPKGTDKPKLKASWCYCNTPQEVAMLSYLIREVEVEHLYLGVTVHLATSASGDAGSGDLSLHESVGNDVAATCAAMEMLLRELRNQASLRYLRVDFNVLATTCSPFEPMACRLLGIDAVTTSLNLLTDELRSLLDQNTGIKTFKLGLHQRLYDLFDSSDLHQAKQRTEQRMAVLMGKHDRAGARSWLNELPAELLQQVLDMAVPLDQNVEVLPLRK